MTLTSREDYEKLACMAIDKFKEGTPLNESIADISADHELNPEQIKRLIEVTNTGAFLDLFKGMQGSDRMVEFDVADPSKIMELFHSKMGPRISKKTTIVITKTEPGDSPDIGFFDDIADSNRSFPEPAPSAPAEVVVKEKTAEDRYMAREYVAVLVDKLQDKIASAEYGMDDIASAIAGNFRDIYSREMYPEYVKHAFITHGPEAVYAIRHVSAKLGLNTNIPAPSEDSVKTAADRTLVKKTKTLDLVAAYLDQYGKKETARRAIDKLQGM